MKKHEEGITLIQTVIAIVMIVLIATFAVLNSTDTAIESKIAKVYNEIVTVKKAVLELEMLEPNALDIISGDRINNFDAYEGLKDKDKPDQKYYLLDFENKKNVLYDILDIRNVENNYIVNVKSLDELEIFLVNGLQIKEDVLYTDYEILEKYNEIFAGR